MTTQKNTSKFVICIQTDDPDVLTPRMVYEVLPDVDAEKSDYLRVVDNEGEDYLYPASYFVPVSFPAGVQKTLSTLSLFNPKQQTKYPIRAKSHRVAED
jgi:hypothetical protein